MREACLVETAVPDTPEDIKKREEEKKKDERAAAAAPNFGGSNQVLSLSLSLSLSEAAAAAGNCLSCVTPATFHRHTHT
jgi:hypothetical protein